MERNRQFESLKATTLYCQKCQQAMPVREKLLLVLADKEIYDYCCQRCGDSLGRREITHAEKRIAQALAHRPTMAPPSPPRH